MAAALVQSPIQSKMADVQPVEESATNNRVELDSAGDEWNADLHVSTKLQNADGTWRKKPGAKKDYVKIFGRELSLRKKAAGTLAPVDGRDRGRSEEHTSELQSLMRNSYAVLCL